MQIPDQLLCGYIPICKKYKGLAIKDTLYFMPEGFRSPENVQTLFACENNMTVLDLLYRFQNYPQTSKVLLMNQHHVQMLHNGDFMSRQEIDTPLTCSLSIHAKRQRKADVCVQHTLTERQSWGPDGQLGITIREPPRVQKTDIFIIFYWFVLYSVTCLKTCHFTACFTSSFGRLHTHKYMLSNGGNNWECTKMPGDNI